MPKEKSSYKSALKVNQGIDQPTGFNPKARQQIIKNKQSEVSAKQLFEGIISGNRALLSKAITLVESALMKHQQIAREVVEMCIPYSGKSIRVGITGVPGAGKSTFIEALGIYLTGHNHKLAVLAIDPSSERTKGSILGDKTRMEALANDPNAFIRPSPAAGSLGGVARKTKETITLCEAAGFDIIFVETVGVGQSETAVHSMVDFFLLIMLAGAGDELQGIKRGIMEMADAIVINKADGDNIHKAERAKQEYANALHLFPPSPSGWMPVAQTCSSIQKTGIEEVWKSIIDYTSITRQNGFFAEKRQLQELRMMHNAIQNALHDNFYFNPTVKSNLIRAEQNIKAGITSAYHEATKLIEHFYNTLKSDHNY